MHQALRDVVVGRACLTRCQPFGDDAARREMRRRCSDYLRADLPSGVPAVAVGDEATYALRGSRESGADQWRGLWFRAADGRQAYALLEGGPRFEADLERLVRTLDAAPRPLRRLEVVEDPRRHRDLMEWLIAHPGPWAFDTETFDGAEFPSRRSVSTDPCHPDFRLRGVAVAWAEDEGAWLEVAPLGRDVWVPYLTRLFGSPAPKDAHNGYYDEDGIVFPGWAPAVINRNEDSMLAFVSLSDGRHPSLRLERLAVDLLGQDQWWETFDKAQVRDAPLAQVAQAAVYDAGTALWLCTHAGDMMAAGIYWDGQ